MGKIISGIQQMGVGVPNFKEAFNWYIKNFNMNIKVFEEEAVAELMLPHTDGETRKRIAALAINMEGGGGFEIWQHTGKTPAMKEKSLRLGDLGINYAKLKTRHIETKFNEFKKNKVEILGKISTTPSGEKHFFVKDPYENIFEIVEVNSYFKKRNTNGGVYGAVIGVKNIEESLKVYKGILEYDQIASDTTAHFEDFKALPGGHEEVRRVLLRHTSKRKGAFAPMFGPTEIELIEVKTRKPEDIFEGRIWGDPGFIHLCFDIQGMDDMRKECESKGFPFTVDSQRDNPSFDMGEAAGSFSYIQAPEGTLIEFVETHKVPLVKKWKWYLNLQKRNPEKPLPRFMLSAMGMNKVDEV
ncbi:MAG: glyoxalase [Salinivirgaceae bacterium]|nr:MAG: glyoxalase [Salinivirgaceae bacterium]